MEWYQIAYKATSRGVRERHPTLDVAIANATPGIVASAESNRTNMTILNVSSFKKEWANAGCCAAENGNDFCTVKNARSWFSDMQ
jgi:hypothetical protein